MKIVFEIDGLVKYAEHAHPLHPYQHAIEFDSRHKGPLYRRNEVEAHTFIEGVPSKMNNPDFKIEE